MFGVTTKNSMATLIFLGMIHTRSLFTTIKYIGKTVVFFCRKIANSRSACGMLYGRHCWFFVMFIAWFRNP